MCLSDITKQEGKCLIIDPITKLNVYLMTATKSILTLEDKQKNCGDNCILKYDHKTGVFVYHTKKNPKTIWGKFFPKEPKGTREHPLDDDKKSAKLNTECVCV